MVKQDDEIKPEHKELTEQEPLFSLEIIELRPVLGNTAHLKNTAIASDGLEYAIKGISDGENSFVKNVPYPKQVPASEWFCSKLAEISGIPTPTCRVLFYPDNNEYFFGSQYDLASLPTAIDQANIVQSLMSDDPLLRRQFWAIYAFDQFVYNVDRHVNNYLYSTNRDGHFICKAFDFSLSSLVMGWPNKYNDMLIPNGMNTTNVWSAIKNLTSFDKSCKDYALKVLGYIDKIEVESVDNIFSQMPESWINPLQKEALISWWGGSGKKKRVNSVRNEVLK
ncbi:HipA family kinase [Xenorhabdus cabanillasii]|uniref:HipA family kinase n=1 Tax=Xenorhabdus cabanillasii TaxID=351673 RepID=UPI0006855FC7|nr:HipA family kinase [Xenorhabdus cabanillasii]